MPGDAASLLLVDDDEINRIILSRGLAKLGHEVEVADSGSRVLRMLRSQRTFDAILVDILMPEMDGYDLLRYIRANPSLSHLPVIMMSAINDVASVAQCLNLGADDYLSKPFEPVLWEARIQSVLTKKRLRDIEQVYLRQIEEEEARSERLLLNILPEAIAARLKDGASIIADYYDDVTVLFGDLVGFTELAGAISPRATVELLSEIFSRFDALSNLHGLEKIKTIGDAYMVVGGVPVPRPHHTAAVAAMALDMLAAVAAVESYDLQLRIGIHYGPVVAGVIGVEKFSYDLWGDTVNLASRMESHGIPGRIQVTDEVRQRLDGEFVFEERGHITVKGKGDVLTSFLVTKK